MPATARRIAAPDPLATPALGECRACDLGLPDEALAKLAPVRPGHDAVVLAGGGARTLDLLRLATVRSDDVTVIAPRLDAQAQRYAERFAVLWRRREAQPHDLDGASALLVSLDDAEAENVLVRAARRRALPVHVDGRPLVSDFALIDFLERKPQTLRAGA